MKFITKAFQTLEEAEKCTASPVKIVDAMPAGVIVTYLDMDSLTLEQREQVKENKNLVERPLTLLAAIEHQDFLSDWCATAIEKEIIRQDDPDFIVEALEKMIGYKPTKDKLEFLSLYV